MTKGLVRYYGAAHLRFITCSCYGRQPQLHTARHRDLFLTILEETRRKYRFVVHGYVVMPGHFHLLITEPEVGDPSVVMKVVEQPDQWKWSSFRAYFYGERGLVRVNFQERRLEIQARPPERFTDDGSTQRPLIRKVRE